MIDPLSPDLLTLGAAAKLLPGRPAVSTLWRWATSENRFGLVLESIVVGGQRVTSADSIREYVAACTRAANGEQPDQQPRTSKQRQKAIDAAERELQAAGA